MSLNKLFYHLMAILLINKLFSYIFNLLSFIINFINSLLLVNKKLTFAYKKNVIN